MCNSIIHDSKPSRKQHFKNAILTVLLLSWMTWVFAQATKTGKETLKKEPPIHIVANDSVDIAGFRVSQDEAKIYENFLANRGQYGSEQQMTSNYKKRITMNRRKKQLEEELAAAKREEARLDQVIVEADSRIESKKQVIVEADSRIESKKQVIVEKAGVEKQVDQVIVEADSRIESKKQVIVEADSRIEGKKQEIVEKDKTIEQLKQQLFQAREKKLGRALTEKEKEEILKNIQ